MIRIYMIMNQYLSGSGKLAVAVSVAAYVPFNAFTGCVDIEVWVGSVSGWVGDGAVGKDLCFWMPVKDCS